MMEFGVWLATRKGKVPEAKCADALAALIAAKTASNRRPRYVHGLRLYVAQFLAGREQEPVGSIGHEDVERWFRERGESPCVMRGNLGRLSSFFSFCMRHGWIERNPLARVERPTVEVPEPFILTVEQCRTLVERCPPEKLVLLTLALFCGLRPSEAAAVSGEQIDLAAAVVRLTAAQSKTRRRRTIPIPPNAVALMQGRTSLVRPVGRYGWETLTRFMCGALGFRRWPQDALRHTAASMMLVRDQDAGKVALALGNSPAILLRHYVSLVSVDDARAFWELRP